MRIALALFDGDTEVGGRVSDYPLNDVLVKVYPKPNVYIIDPLYNTASLNASDIKFANYSNVDPETGKLISNTDTIASISLIKIEGRHLRMKYAHSGKVIGYCIGCFDANADFIERINWVFGVSSIELPEGTKYIRIALSVRVGGSSIGGDVEDYNIDELWFWSDLGNLTSIFNDELKLEMANLDTKIRTVYRLDNGLNLSTIPFINHRTYASNWYPPVQTEKMIASDTFIDVEGTNYIIFNWEGNHNGNKLHYLVQLYDKDFNTLESRLGPNIRAVFALPGGTRYIRVALGLLNSQSQDIGGDQDDYNLEDLYLYARYCSNYDGEPIKIKQ